jgi:hypothetical protein
MKQMKKIKEIKLTITNEKGEKVYESIINESQGVGTNQPQQINCSI